MNSRPRCYFSLRSPYSWLAHHDLTAGHQDIVALLDWRPFWEPDERSLQLLTMAGGRFPYVPMTRDKSLYILQDVRRLAAERKLPIAWPVDRNPWWEVPHLAYLAAARQGSGPAFIAAAYRARWLAGRDICDRTTIGELADELGLDAGQLVAAPEDSELRAAGVKALLEVHRDGVFGVPFFVNGHDKYWGVDRLTAFIGRLRSAPAAPVDPVTAQPASVAVMRHSAADGGHAGGCG